MKYALVTGATKGIGRAITEKLFSEGYFVFLNYAHDRKSAEDLCNKLDNTGASRCQWIHADLSKLESIDVVEKGIKEITNSLDALIINAACTDYSKYEDITWESWMRVMNTNLNVPFFLIQKLAPIIAMGGTITMIGSVMGQVPHAVSYAYGVSKAGLHFLSRELVKAFADRYVRVNAVCPAFVETIWQENKDLELRTKIEAKIALHRFAEPTEIADMVYAIIQNTYVNGSIINIDGGYSYY